MGTTDLDDGRQRARLALLRRLDSLGYRFTTPAPGTHRRVLLRRGLRDARSLEEVFGWNLPFRQAWMDPELFTLLQAADAVRRHGPRWRAALRAASVGPLLFLHSAFPPREVDAVFFGPDSYRFTDFIRAELPALGPGARIIDIGAGSGVGGIFASSLRPQAQLTLTDVNPAALALAAVNAAFAGIDPGLVRGPGLPDAAGEADIIVANPPYIGGGPHQAYADGGGLLGEQASVDWARAAAARLAPGGRLLLYSGSAIVNGEDRMKAALARIADAAGMAFAYRELDPDVFPATLARPAYWRAERIAAIGAVLSRSS